jgi:hypothetical protein
MAMSLKPGVDLHVAKGSWFIHNGTAYSVKDAPTDVFKSAVLAMMPGWRQCAQYCYVLKSKEDIDIYARWWLLCCLKDAKKAITLYASRDEAEQELHSEQAG